MSESSHAQALELKDLSAALETATEGVVITDRASNIEWVNPAFANMTGYTRREAVEEAPALHPFGEYIGCSWAKFWRAVLSGEVWRGRVNSRRKDGSTYEREAIVTPIRDQSGRVTRLVAVHCKLGEEKLEPAALQSLERALRNGLRALVARTSVCDGVLPQAPKHSPPGKATAG